MGTLNRWMKRLQQFFGGEYSEETQVVQNRKIETPRYESISTKKQESQSRVVYHYPKNGKFRFPVIEDAPKRHKDNQKFQAQGKKVVIKSDSKKKDISSKKVNHETPVSKPRFSNSDFKLTAIPSPVYGFRERETAKSKLGDNLSILPFEKREEERPKSSKPPIQKNGLEVFEEQTSGTKRLSKKSDLLFGEQTGLISKPEDPINTLEVQPIHSIEGEASYKEVKSFNVPAILEEALTLDKQDLQEIGNETEEEKVREHAEPTEEEEVLEYTEEIVEEEIHEHAEAIEEEKVREHAEETGEEEVLEYTEETVEEEIHEHAEATGEEEVLEYTEESEEEEVYELAEETLKNEELESRKERGKEKGPNASKHSQSIEHNKESAISIQPTTEQKKTSKPAVPFNVMMLPQDKAQKKQLQSAPIQKSSTYSFPNIQLLNYPALQEKDETDWLDEQGAILEETLQSFHVDAKVVHVTKGPSVTRFEVQPGRGVKVTKITGLSDDMKLALAAKDIRIEAPIPGKNTIGIEVPNRESTPVFLREILRRGTFVRSTSPLTVALGLDISGQPIVTDLQKMPHGLVAGATGSGKSVCINSVLISLLFKASPDVVKLMLIDPKMVELAPYNGLPHLVTPVITDAKQATAALKWVVLEMERRYELFSQKGCRDVGRYNEIYSESSEKPELPYILVVIDELADLMMVSPQEVEDSICRIAQKARACGIHLLLATQRPSVDVITGLIKANIPTRIAFSVSSQTDSRTILDMGGAERLLGKGDMLFHENGTPKPVRVQGTFVSDEEIEDVVAYVKKQREPEYLLQTDQLKSVAHEEVDDEHFEEACYYVIDQGSASASSLQRKFRVGYNRAARLIDMMEDRGIVSQAMGSKPRHVLVDEISIEEILYHKEG
ncbi:DNA translocase FtsK [Halalkalibacter kiskunsagensis]|uniref:DNA translocase FtsK n=1 Tax=Halalkalibacter kiskunsagensis TaxID=1548599 RepID=A0ABV6KIZ3_9BACI